MAVCALAAFSATFMTGVIWFVQVVHYPLFPEVGSDQWMPYHAAHTRRTGWVVAPVMIIELGASLAVVVQAVTALAVAGLGFAAATWVLTFGLAVPDHGRLEHGFDARVARRLVVLGWGRCGAWTAHSVVALIMLAS